MLQVPTEAKWGEVAVVTNSMEMQKKTSLSLALIAFLGMAQAQSNFSIDSLTTMKPMSKEVEANFLSSYYHQEGDNAAVTGGIGTEKLTDISNVFILNVPIDSVNAVNLYTGVDYYSSASTDAIDTQVSSASSSDVRAFGTLSYSRLNLVKNETYSFKVGFSTEFDYQSISAGISYSKEWNESNTQLTASGQAYFDRWALIYPIELRGSQSLSGAGRQSFNGGLIFSQILTKRLQMSLSSEIIYMSGLLSTPFHRVYFQDTEIANLEKLPNSRMKIPLSIRLHYFPFDGLVLRAYYRYYWDDFGVIGHTASLEAPIKLSQSFTFTPFFRYHTQEGSTYFAGYQEHISSDEYYTSDYDLSALNSQTYGLGIKYYPTFGIARSQPIGPKKAVLMFKYAEIRGANYQRSTGLNAFVTSLNLGFGFK